MRVTARQLFVLLLFLGLFAMTLRPVADPDFWWHLRTGQWIAETHAIPHADPFSFTNQGKTWLAHEWLSELLIYSLYRTGGFGLLILAFATIITATFLLVYQHSAERPYIAGFALLLGALASAPTWGARPQMITHLFFALYLYFLDRYANTRKAKTLMPIPILMLLWVNLHAAYALGDGLVGVYLAGDLFELVKAKLTTKVATTDRSDDFNRSGEAMTKVATTNRSNDFSRSAERATKIATTKSFREVLMLCGILALCVLAALANPNGIHLLTYPFETLSSQAMQQNIQEWFSPDFHQLEWQPLAWLILALIGAGLLGRKSLSPTKILLTLIFGYLALHSMRHVPLFAIAAVPVLAEQIGSAVQIRQQASPRALTPSRCPSGSRTVRSAGRVLKWVNLLMVACAALVAGLRFVSVVQEQAATEKEKFPAAAVDWIVQHRPAGNLFNTYGWGGYLIWRLYPGYQVYIDGRADVYGDAFITDYLRLEAGEPGWDTSLARDDVRIVLLEPASLLVRELRLSPDWGVVFSDEQSILFIHK